MIVQLHITDDEIQTFFEGLGYACEMVEVPQCRKATHGADEVTMSPSLHVIIDGFGLKAASLMNEYAKNMILRPHSSAEANVDQAARTLMKYCALKIRGKVEETDLLDNHRIINNHKLNNNGSN